MPTANLTYRPADARGVTDINWLKSRHSFSFGQYNDPNNTHFRVLRVINDDIVAPGGGFGEHGHDNMEIMTWVLSGALEHGDSLGHMQTLQPGELQVMTAGRGIRHSEMNASDTEPAHFLQMWIFPATRDAEPNYEQKSFDAADRDGKWDTLASGRGHATAVSINQEAELRVADVKARNTISVSIEEGRFGYLHIATGEAQVDGQALSAGDALTIEGLAAFEVSANADTQLILFDLP